MPTILKAIVLLIAAAAPAAACAADTFVDRINEAFSRVSDDRRSDLVMLPVLIDLQPPPATLLQRADRAALVLTTSRAWPALDEWASAETQQAALAALATVAEEENPRRAMIFALPYGINGVPTDFIRAGVHAELGDPPTIAAVQLGYMERFAWLRMLVDVETTRLIEAGDAEKAVEINLDLSGFARQIADRQLGEEVAWGLETIGHAMRRIRDVVYIDSKTSETLTAEFLKSIVDRIDTERGFYRIDRIRLPVGDRQAALQLIDRVFDASGRPNEAVFPAAMAEMAATGRPLRLFAEAGRWAGQVGSHANASDTRTAVEGVYNDWATRWSADPFDPLQRTRTAYEQLSNRSQGFEVVSESVPELGRLFALRRAVQAEAVGTRCSLATRSLTAATGAKASTLAILRPRYIDDLGVDPFNPDTAVNNRPELKYFVPERDDINRQAHRMNVVSRSHPNFSAVLTDSDFVIYSLGGNENDDKALNVSDDPAAQIGDYLIWPPVISLTRDYLRQTGDSE